jgi:hypothetical protein
LYLKRREMAEFAIKFLKREYIGDSGIGLFE